MFESILNNSVSTLSITDALTCTFISLFLGILIALIHMKTEKHYTNHFIITLALLPLLVQVVIMMVNGNLGTSVAIMGSFALIRFRSMPATSKEITCVFLAMAIGLSTGMGYLTFAVLLAIITSCMLFLFYKIHFGEPKIKRKTLKITIPETLDYIEVFDDLFQKYTEFHDLIKVKTTNMGSLFELTYQIIPKHSIHEKDFIDDLRSRNGNLSIILERAEMGISEL